ncbi:MAG: TadE/TadG family type IV pilus assembly protein [Hyphomicrobiaceae bacterium]|nr:TadE/TadG family type IV pilus assembly protein [Hyphomicrobiaceae bacterium]
MSAIRQSRITQGTARLAALLAHWRQDQRGAAAVEFAFIAPIVTALFIGAVEMSQALTVDRRAAQVATSMADLVARTNASIAQSDMTDIMKIGGFIMLPYTSAPLETTVRNVTSSPSNATTAKQSWYCTYNTNGSGTNTCACNVTSFTLPSGLVSTNDSVVVAEVRYFYTPLVFDKFLKSSLTKTGSYYTLSKKAYAKPRSQAAMLLQANGTACPSPTFP